MSSAIPGLSSQNQSEHGRVGKVLPRPDAGSPVRMPTPEQLATIERQNAALETASAEDILTWAVATYFPHFTMATGLGPEGCVIISMLAKIEPRVYIFNLDTGYQFRETLELRDRIAEKYGIVVDLQEPELWSRPTKRHTAGPSPVQSRSMLFRSEGGRATRVAKKYDAWATGIRRDQGPTRRYAHRPLGQKIRPGEAQPSGHLDKKRRLEANFEGKGALQSAARSGLSQHRLLAVHAIDNARRGRVRGKMDGESQDRMRFAHSWRVADRFSDLQHQAATDGRGSVFCTLIEPCIASGARATNGSPVSRA